MMANNLTHQSQSAGWVHPTNPELWKKVISPKFSRQVEIKLQKIDKAGIPTCLDSCFRHDVYIALVKYYFETRGAHGRRRIVEDLGGDLSTIYTLDSQLTLEKIPSSCDIINFATQQLNRAPIQAALVLGELQGISPENCFERFPASTPIDTVHGRQPITRTCIPSSLLVMGKPFSLQYVDEQHDFAGKLDHAICHYSAGQEDNFFVVAARGEIDSEIALQVGGSQAVGWPLSRVAIVKQPKANIIFCMSLPLALCLRSLTKAANMTDGVIITGHLGPLGALYTQDFWGCQVNLIPDFSREGILEALSFAKMLIKAGATGVTLYPYPIATDASEATKLAVVAGSPWKSALLPKLTNLQEVEIISNYLRRLLADSLPLEAMKAMADKLGLVQPEDQPLPDVSSSLRITDLDNENVEPEINFDANPLLSNLIHPGFLLFIWGGTDSGKSLIALTLAIASATGKGAFCFSNTAAPCKVLFLDGELTIEQFKARFKQLTPSTPLRELARGNIYPMLARDPKVGRYDLLDKTFQANLILFIVQNGIAVVEVDNLITLGGKALKGREDELFNFFYEIESHGVAVIFVNHATKDNEHFKGSADIASKSQTIIQVEGRPVLARDDDASDAVKAALANDGDAVARLNFLKCKLPPKLNGKHEVYHLPIGGTWRYLEGNAPCAVPLPVSALDVGEEIMHGDTAAALTSANAQSLLSGMPSPALAESSLSHDQKCLFSLFDSEKPISRKKIEAALGWGEDKAGNELKALKIQGLIKGIGSGRSTRYIKA